MLGVAFAIEGGGAVDDQPDLVRLYAALGVRWMLMAYNRPNRLGGGRHGHDDGLTAFGRRVLAEMARAGVVACCTHTGWRTAREVIDAPPDPVIFSHSNTHAVHPHPRNVPDELIHACAERGGVVRINGVSLFLGPGGLVERLYTRVSHVAQLAGLEHVGLGLDYVYDAAELEEALSSMSETFPAGEGYDDPNAIGFVALKPRQALLSGSLGPATAAKRSRRS